MQYEISFLFKFDLNVKYRPYFFSNKMHVLQKNRLLSVDYVTINELHVVHT